MPRRLLLACVLAIGCQRASTDDPVAPTPANEGSDVSAHAPAPDNAADAAPPVVDDQPGFYMGRELAATMT